MIKRCLKLIFLYLIFINITIINHNKVIAQSSQSNCFVENPDVEKEYIKDIYNETGLDEIISRYLDIETSESIKNVFNQEKNLEENHILLFSPKKIIDLFIKQIKEEIKQPITLIANILGIILVSLIIETIKTSFNNSSLTEIMNCVSVMVAFIIIGSPLIEFMKSSINVITTISDCIISFVPVYMGLIATSGLFLTSSLYNTCLFFICQIFSQILTTKLMPMTGIYMSFCLVGSLAPNFNVSFAAKEIKNIITWILTFLISIFIGLITVHGVVSVSLDSIEMKTAKFMISSSIPIIGSVISDSYSTVKGCLNFVRAETGTIFIILIAVLFFPLLIKVTIWLIMIKLSSGLSSFMGEKQISKFLKSINYVVSLFLALIISYFLLMVINITIILIFGLGLT